MLDVSGSALLASLEADDAENSNNAACVGILPEWVTFFASSTILPLMAFHRRRCTHNKYSPKKKAPPLQGTPGENLLSDSAASAFEYDQWRSCETVNDVRVTWMLTRVSFMTLIKPFSLGPTQSSSTTTSMFTLEGVCDHVAIIHLQVGVWVIGSRGLLRRFYGKSGHDVIVFVDGEAS